MKNKWMKRYGEMGWEEINQSGHVSINGHKLVSQTDNNR